MKPDEAPLAETLTDNIAGTATYDIAEPRLDSEGKVTAVVLQLDDGRMVPAALKDGLELVKGDILKSSRATVKHDGISDGVPTNAVVTKIER